jgi:hypothetical protein
MQKFLSMTLSSELLVFNHNNQLKSIIYQKLIPYSECLKLSQNHMEYNDEQESLLEFENFLC